MNTSEMTLSRTDLEELGRLQDVLGQPIRAETAERGVLLPGTAIPVLRRSIALLLEISDPPADTGGADLVPTRAAANILNVPADYLEHLLDAGEIASTRTARGIFVDRMSLLAYKERRDLKRRALLEQLVRADEEAGLYQREVEEGW